MDDTHPCPRCGTPVRWQGVGRKPVWCSTECRRRGHEQNIRVREVVRERVVEVQVPHNPVTAAEVVLGDVDATRELLRLLTRRVRSEPATESERVRLRRLLFLSDDVDRLTTAIQEVTAREMPAVAARRRTPAQPVRRPLPTDVVYTRRPQPQQATEPADPSSGETAPAPAPQSPASARGKGQKKKKRRRRR